jgi:hypothetical protein
MCRLPLLDHLILKVSIIGALLMPLAIAGISTPVVAAGEIEIISNQHQASFPSDITFSLTARGTENITRIALLYGLKGEIVTTRVPLKIEAGSQVSVEHRWNLRLNYIPPGVEVRYHWVVEDEAGNQLQTEPITFTYQDDHHPWRELASDELILRWYEGDDEFGQSLFSTATQTEETLRREIDAPPGAPIQIYIYANQDDLLAASGEGTKEWTGGISFSHYGIILIGVSPHNLEWGHGAVAHELAHAVLYQAAGNPYSDLPTWLEEGLAIRAQGDFVESYDSTLEQSIGEDELISLRSLSSSFPADPGLAHLSYAESQSVVDYMFDSYGTEGMARLIDNFKDGAYYEDALQESLGFGIDELEDEWRADIGASPRSHADPTPISDQSPTPTQAGNVPSPTTDSSPDACCLPLVGGLPFLALLLRRF